jgi:leucyl-tRNA synthetase
MVSPDEMYAAYGADTLRVYEMGMGPLEQSKPWETRAVVGSLRFLQRLWRNVVDESTGAAAVVDELPDQALTTALHRPSSGSARTTRRCASTRRSPSSSNSTTP